MNAVALENEQENEEFNNKDEEINKSTLQLENSQTQTQQESNTNEFLTHDEDNLKKFYEKISGDIPSIQQNTHYSDDETMKFQELLNDPLENIKKEDEKEQNEQYDRIQCKFCERKFALDRIEKHEKVCQINNNNKRKAFDSKKQRLKDNLYSEFYYNETMKTSGIQQPKKKFESNCHSGQKQPKWKIDHQNFLNALKNQRKDIKKEKDDSEILNITTHNDTNNDYVFCQYCQRKFAPNIAVAHIPKCKNIMHRPNPPIQCPFQKLAVKPRKLPPLSSKIPSQIATCVSLATNFDYEICQYCNRKFNKRAAERHIPICKNIRNRVKPFSQENNKKCGVILHGISTAENDSKRQLMIIGKIKHQEIARKKDSYKEPLAQKTNFQSTTGKKNSMSYRSISPLVKAKNNKMAQQFCTNCGIKFHHPLNNFCSNCGQKRMNNVSVQKFQAI